ncbi:fused MFS/spermidine synthase [Mesorhizobium sp. YC-39]|uniref:spermidine synthase n=1 Tax=unclassified Mesorhizobium TaxID=325217 RepID=UPI0021E943B5|nr:MULTISPECIES: fused MFS/spermidine synthase [unclassified Mesorhizobium]MCV3210760.1 fused MFS/spermidine synthase [Mesorhizobium sp. YC-2]MCV3230994.1 fused MFS/spermidine synthase [Mesorhizobium sp. YC-39]
MIRIAKYHSDFGNIEVLRAKDTGSFIYRQGGCYQSECDQSGISIVPYIHAIFGLLAQARVSDVLMIGCGGGSLGTMLHRTGARVTIVDINPSAFQIARKYFGLPREIDCHVADGRDFLRAARHRYDAIVLDAYSGRRIPAHLCAETFFGLVQTRLNASGCLLANVHARHDLDMMPDRVAAKTNNIWADVRLLDARGMPDRNALVMAGKVRALVQPALLMPPSVGAEEIARELGLLAFRPWHSLRRKP